MHPFTRRRHKRYDNRSQIAIVFDRSRAHPTLHTQLCDVSHGGAAFESSHRDLLGQYVTVLVIPDTEAPRMPARMLRFRARVVWNVQIFTSPNQVRFRHGLEFLAYGSDDSTLLVAGIERKRDPGGQHVPPAGCRLAGASAVDAENFQATAGDAARLLQRLSDAADERRRIHAELISRAETSAQHCSNVLRSIHDYLAELANHLNEIKPTVPDDAYRIAYIGSPIGLHWAHGSSFLTTREVDQSRSRATEVCLRYELKTERPASIELEPPATDSMHQRLVEHDLAYSSTESRNDRGRVIRTKFELPYTIVGMIRITANSDPSNLVVRLRNVGNFGTTEAIFPAAAVDEAWLDRLGEGVLCRNRSVDYLTALSPAAA